MRAVVLTAVVGVMLATTGASAFAADPCLNPSDDMIFSCLKPGKTRGIRPGGAPAATAEPTPVAAAPAPAARPAAPAPVREAVVRPQPVIARSPATQPVTSQPVASQPAAAPEASGRVDLALQFATGSADASPEARARLDGLGRQLARPELADMHFRIEGHTDTTGGRETNRILSQRRAEAIVAYLTTKFGLPAARLEAVGVGEDDLPVPTGANVPEPRNRVVRIVALGG